jgi:hypothetical protein
MIKEHDCGVLTANVPDEGLVAGDIGTVAHIHKGGECYEVEFMTLTGETVAIVTLLAGQVCPLNRRDLAHTRELAPAGALVAFPSSSDVAEAALSLRALRRQIMAANGWSLPDLYRTFETPSTNRPPCDAQAALDSAYGMKENEDILALLLHLNLDLADRETKGQHIRPPGLPALTRAPEHLTSPGCIRGWLRRRPLPPSR